MIISVIFSGVQRLEEAARAHEIEMAEVVRKSRFENGEKLESMQRSFEKQIQELNVSTQ